MNKWPKLGRGKYFANDRIWVGAAAGAQLVPDDNLSLTRSH
jgi:hypothetical protein